MGSGHGFTRTSVSCPRTSLPQVQSAGGAPVAECTRVCCSPNGSAVASFFTDGTVQVHTIRQQRGLEHVCTIGAPAAGCGLNAASAEPPCADMVWQSLGMYIWWCGLNVLRRHEWGDGKAPAAGVAKAGDQWFLPDSVSCVSCADGCDGAQPQTLVIGLAGGTVVLFDTIQGDRPG